MKKIFIILGLTFVLLILALQVDDELSPEVISLIERVDTNGESEPYTYLHGVFANETEDPLAVGKSVLLEYEKSQSDKSYKPNFYPDSQMLPLPDGPAFCRLSEDGCLENLFSTDINIKDLLIENKVLLSRYDEFLAFDDFKTTLKPSIEEVMPPYQYLLLASRLKLLDAIFTYKEGGLIPASNFLSSQIKALRKHLVLQDNLIGKMVFVQKLSDFIDVYSVMLSKKGIDAPKIPRLGLNETSFSIPLAREFVMGFYGYKDLDRYPDLLEVGVDLPGWVVRIFYKPNISVNAVVPMYIRAENLSKLTPKEFSVKVNSTQKAVSLDFDWRNLVGNVLASMPHPGFEKYIARVNDLDVKIALFNQLHHEKLPVGEFFNPYYGKEQPVKTSNGYCFNGPLDDDRSIRCLRTKL